MEQNMAFSSFQEYMDHKNKVKNDPKIEKVADYHGPQDTKPAKEKKHKDAGGSGQVGETKGYKPSNSPIDPNKGKKDGKGFADEGDKALKYEPGEVWVGGKDGVSNSKNGVPGGKNVSTWPKTKTQEWVNKNKGVSMSEFTKRMQQEVEDECGNNAYATIRNVVELCQCNNKYINNLVREMKRNDLLPLLSEAIAPPLHKYDDEMNDIDGEMDAPEGDMDDDMGDGSDMDISSDDDMGDEMDNEDDLGDMGDDMGDDMSDDMGDDEGSALGKPEGDMDMPMPKPKKKKKHPHAAHALNAMQGPPAPMDAPMDAPMMMKKKMKKS